jgi:hypothetical protein
MASRNVYFGKALLAVIAPFALLSAVSCAGEHASLPGPSAVPAASAPASSLAASSPREAILDVTKECSQFASEGFCTITASNLKQIEVGTKIIYLNPAGVPQSGVGSDVILDPPGPGNNQAFGHCELSATAQRCTFSGGNGMFNHFTADVIVSVSAAGRPFFDWHGAYSFTPDN